MKLPEPQGYLSKEGKEYYKEICEHLEGVDALERVDSYGLSMIAHWLWLNDRASEAVKENGGVQVYSTGAEGVSAHLTVMKTAVMMWDKLAPKFGLSVKDRELIQKFKSKRKETDALDEL